VPCAVWPIVATMTYIKGFPSEKALGELARQSIRKGEEWRCMWFLKYACPDALVGMISSPSLFRARHEVAHEGATTASDRDIRMIRSFADEAILAALDWFALHPSGSITDLDAEIDAAAASSHPWLTGTGATGGS
jgi:hypothetical protein